MTPYASTEKELSQNPAVQLLQSMGYEYISSRDALLQRQGRSTNVLLQNILQEKLKEINIFYHKGRTHSFSDEAIKSAMKKLEPSTETGLLSINRTIYDNLMLGTAQEQTVDGDKKSFTLRYIDWDDHARNVFHVATEYHVENPQGLQSARPDIVLFVNGIPFCVIECKHPAHDISEAISQCIRNQDKDYIPQLFFYNQLLIAINKNGGRYATAGTGENFWATWQEPTMQEGSAPYETLQQLVNASCAPNPTQKRTITEQDKLLYALCYPQRLLELVKNFIVFDNNTKKIARYQQYFVVKSTLKRIEQYDEEGNRAGGIIFQTQGSGKSLIMVMLTQNLIHRSNIKNPRIVLVTDRIDLDKQLANTFHNCDVEVCSAKTGKELLRLIQEKKSMVITTLVHKFQNASHHETFQDDSADIFMLVDESHRTQFGSFAAEMRRIFPKACYIGFTGTPLMKTEKNNFAKFGRLIEPHYSITDAIADKAIVPLLYEGRLTKINQNEEAIDLWFERYTNALTPTQQHRLKKRHTHATMLSKADKVIHMRAFDITEHFSCHVKDKGCTAQIVAPNKASAIQYHKYIQDIRNGDIVSEVVISPPDMRETYEEVEDESTDTVVQFWKTMMKRHGNEEQYMKNIVDRFKKGDVHIIIVVSKLLTGFDAPKNTVLYLCNTLKEHTLLQAIGRVNRTCEGKEWGFIIDYAGILGELDKAFSMYKVFEDFDEQDLQGTLISIHDEIKKLPECYSHVWDIFKTEQDTDDAEAFEVLLADEKLREDFYEKLSTFNTIFALACSSEKFLTEIDKETLTRYKDDLRNFQSLKASVKQRYADDIDYRNHDKNIKTVLDKYIESYDIVSMNEPANILEKESFYEVQEAHGTYATKHAAMAKQVHEIHKNQNPSRAKQADTIAYATKKSITEKMSTDPSFYEKFSKLIETLIQDFRDKRISDIQYLDKVMQIQQEITNKNREDVPALLHGNEHAIAYYGVTLSFFKGKIHNNEAVDIAGKLAREVYVILKKHKKVDFWNDVDTQNQVKNDIDNYYESNLKENDILSYDELDEIVEKILDIAKAQDNQ